MALKATHPVDEGYSWVILIASFATLFCTCGALYSVSIFNLIFLEVFQESKATTAWIGSLLIGLIALMGPASSAVISNYGWRVATIVGGLIAALGTFASAWANNITQLFITFGIISGIGHGLAYTPAMIVVGYYFERYRAIAVGLSSVGAGMGMMIFPPLIRYVMETCSWREALAIMSCVYFQICVFGALMRPIDTRLLEEGAKVKRKRRLHVLAHVRDLSQAKFLIFCLSIFTFGIGLSAIYLHLSAFAVANGASAEEASFLISILGVLSIVSRIFTGIAGNDHSIDNTILYIGTFGIAGLCTLFGPSIGWSYSGRLLFTVLFGFYGSCFNVLLAPLTVELIGLQNLNWAFGIEMVMCGVSYLIGPPIAGLLYDVTGSYNTSFYLAGGCLITSAFIMMLVSVYEAERGPSDLELVPQVKEVEVPEKEDEKHEIKNSKDSPLDFKSAESNGSLTHVLRISEPLLIEATCTVSTI